MRTTIIAVICTDGQQFDDFIDSLSIPLHCHKLGAYAVAGTLKFIAVFIKSYAMGCTFDGFITLGLEDNYEELINFVKTSMYVGV